MAIPDSSPDLDAQGRTQQATTGGAAGGSQSDTSARSIRDDDIGEAERYKMATADHEGHLFNNRKAHEENTAAVNLAALSAAQASMQRVNVMAEQALANFLSLSHGQGVNGSIVSNRSNHDGVTHSDRQKTMADRHQDIAADAQLNDPAEGASEAAVLKSGQLDNAALASINASIARIQEQVNALQGKS